MGEGRGRSLVPGVLVSLAGACLSRSRHLLRGLPGVGVGREGRPVNRTPKNRKGHARPF